MTRRLRAICGLWFAIALVLHIAPAVAQTTASQQVWQMTTEYPQNPIYELILGDTEAKLAHWQLAATHFRAAAQEATPDSACAERIRELVHEALRSLPTDSNYVAQ